MTEKLQIAIVGLGLIGTSAGLALRRFQDKVTVIGHDRDPGNAGLAKKLGAVDRTEWNLISTVAAADRVLLALPVSELRDTLKAIAADLKPGCVLVDTATVKAPVMQWAAELLPPTVHFVGGHPIVVSEQLGTAGAKADLFDRKLFCLTLDVRTDDPAVRLATDVVEALGAQPYFLDPVEHDGLTAAVEHLPMVLAAALAAVTAASGSWQDMRKLAASQFYSSTLLAAEDGKAVAANLGANREHVVRWLDTLLVELGEWRGRLAAGDDEKLASEAARSLTAGRKWLSAYTRGVWEEDESAPELPTARSAFRDLLGFGRRKAAEPPKRK